MSLTHVYIPVELFRLGISSLPEMSILALVLGFSENGGALMVSNNDLAETLGVHRSSIIDSINRLKSKDYIIDAGDGKQNRMLIRGSSDSLPVGGSASTTSLVGNPDTTGSASPTHNIKNLKETSLLKKGGKFIPPTIDQIKAYVTEKNLSVPVEKFLTYYTESGWKTSKGKPVNNWKLTLINWSDAGGKRNSNRQNQQRDFRNQQSSFGETINV